MFTGVCRCLPVLIGVCRWAPVGTGGRCLVIFKSAKTLITISMYRFAMQDYIVTNFWELLS